MNAAGRLVHQSILSRHLLLTHLLTRRQMGLLILTLGVLMSALSVVYVTHYTRVLQAGYEHQLAEQNRLQVQRGQLLLERGTWMMQARTQQIAEQELDMIMPEEKSVVIVR